MLFRANEWPPNGRSQSIDKLDSGACQNILFQLRYRISWQKCIYLFNLKRSVLLQRAGSNVVSIPSKQKLGSTLKN